MLSDKKDQEIIVDSSPPRESMGHSSDSTPNLPYSHGQAVLPTSTFSPIVSVTSSPISVPQNVTIEHFPLVSSSSNSLYHSSLQPSLIYVPDPPPYPNTVLLTPLGSTLYGNPFPSIYPQTTPLFGSNPLVGSSFSFPQQTFSSNLFSTHGLFLTLFTILSLCMPLLAIPVIFLVLTFPLPFQPFPLILLLSFLIPILLSQPFLTLLSSAPVVLPEGGSLEVGKEDGVEATPSIPPESLILKALTPTLHLSAILPFLPQTLLCLDISDIFALMVP